MKSTRVSVIWYQTFGSRSAIFVGIKRFNKNWISDAEKGLDFHLKKGTGEENVEEESREKRSFPREIINWRIERRGYN